MLNCLLGQDHTLYQLGDTSLHFGDGVRLALGDELRHTRREVKQLEERPKRGQVPVFGPLNVLEVNQLVNRGRGKFW